MRRYKPAVGLALALPTIALTAAEVEEFLQALRPPCVIQRELCTQEPGRLLHLPDLPGSSSS